MDEIQWLRNAARESAAPQDVDVTAEVMRTLREKPQPRSTAILMAMAIGGWAVAGIAILVAQQMVAAWQDPFTDLLRL